MNPVAICEGVIPHRYEAVEITHEIYSPMNYVNEVVLLPIRFLLARESGANRLPDEHGHTLIFNVSRILPSVVEYINVKVEL